MAAMLGLLDYETNIGHHRLTTSAAMPRARPPWQSWPLRAPSRLSYERNGWKVMRRLRGGQAGGAGVEFQGAWVLQWIADDPGVCSETLGTWTSEMRL